MTVDKSAICPEKGVVSENGLFRCLYQTGEQHEDKKSELLILSGAKIYQLDQVVEELGIRVLYYFQDGTDKAFVGEELMHILEYAQVSPERVNKCFVLLSRWN